MPLKHFPCYFFEPGYKIPFVAYNPGLPDYNINDFKMLQMINEALLP